jgi:hypothetical protein
LDWGSDGHHVFSTFGAKSPLLGYGRFLLDVLGLSSLLNIVLHHPQPTVLHVLWLWLNRLHRFNVHGIGIDIGIGSVSNRSCLLNLLFFDASSTLNVLLHRFHKLDGIGPWIPYDAMYPLRRLTIVQNNGLGTILQPKVLFNVCHPPHQHGDLVPQFL